MTTAAIPRPEPSEYVPYYETYLSKVPKGDLLTLLEDQRRETQHLLSGLPEAKALHRYAPGKWSIKEVVGHLMRSEEHTSELQSLAYLVCRLLLEKKKRLQPARRGAGPA